MLQSRQWQINKEITMSDITSDDEKFYIDPSSLPDSRTPPKPIDHDSLARRKKTEEIIKKVDDYGMDYSWFPVVKLGRALKILEGVAPKHWTLYPEEIELLEHILNSFESTMNFGHTDPLPVKKIAKIDPDPS